MSEDKLIDTLPRDGMTMHFVAILIQGIGVGGSTYVYISLIHLFTFTGYNTTWITYTNQSCKFRRR